MGNAVLLLVLILGSCFSYAQGVCSGGGQLGCCACTNNNSQCVHDFNNIYFDSCGCYTVKIGNVYSCFQSGLCETVSGWAYCGLDHPDHVTLFSDASTKPANCEQVVGDSPRPLTPELAKPHPWVNSIALVEAIRGESLVPETADLLKLFQEDAAKKGLGRVRRIQSTQPGPRFVGAWFTYRGSGLYRMDVYQEMPVDGKLQYNGLGELQKARVAPTEVIEISGHNYTHTVNGTEIKGTF